MNEAGCDIIETDDSKKASMLNAYFSSVFVPDDGSLHEFPSRVSQDTFINNIEITAHRVLYFINSVKLVLLLVLMAYRFSF